MNESEAIAFDHWHSRCAHDNGDRKTEDKARVAAINHALGALLISPDAEVTSDGILKWVASNLGFGDAYLHLERINEHLAYEAGREGYGRKRFKPKQPTIRETRVGVFSLAPGCLEFQFKEISHHRQ